MGALLTFLADHRLGIWVLLIGLGALGLVTQWFCWIFKLGRFRSETGIGSRQPNTLRFVTAEFFVRLINDFRHLLALVMVFMFALALFGAMLPGFLQRDISMIKDGLQAVAAALAGLIGSIIGYYFGESAAAKKEQEPRTSIDSSQPPVQGAPAPESGSAAPGSAEIRPAAKPPTSS